MLNAYVLQGIKQLQQMLWASHNQILTKNPTFPGQNRSSTIHNKVHQAHLIAKALVILIWQQTRRNSLGTKLFSYTQPDPGGRPAFPGSF